MNISQKSFNVTKSNIPCTLYHIQNETGAYIEFTDYGCRITSICVPDKDGALVDVCLGYSTLKEYEEDPFYIGAGIGRHANRIGNASFTLSGKTYTLEKNDNGNHLHGGSIAFHNQVWETTVKENKAVMYHQFKDGESGYPGNLDVWITYEWTEESCLHITYDAICDQDTVLNVTNHTYFNLESAQSSVLDQELTIFSSKITENDENCLPTGVIREIAGTPFDFREFKKIGQDIQADYPQINICGGYDHNFILNERSDHKAAILRSQKNNICMTCYTDQPGIQIYVSNFAKPFPDKNGTSKFPRNSICLETQHFPNATTIEDFPSVILKADTKFHSKTSYQFELFDK